MIGDVTPELRLDIAAVAREVAIVAALALIKTAGDADRAIFACDHMRHMAPPTADEFDASSIAGQAIRDAVAIQAGTYRGGFTADPPGPTVAADATVPLVDQLIKMRNRCQIEALGSGGPHHTWWTEKYNAITGVLALLGVTDA